MVDEQLGALWAKACHLICSASGTLAPFDGSLWTLEAPRSFWEFHATFTIFQVFRLEVFKRRRCDNSILIPDDPSLTLWPINMSLSAAQRALGIYEIVELVLSHISTHGHFPNALLFLQRTCTTWRAVISRSFISRGILLLEHPIPGSFHLPQLVLAYPKCSYSSSVEYRYRQLLWVYDSDSHKFSGLHSPAKGFKDVFCEGRASCLDLLLVAPSAPLPVCWFLYSVGCGKFVRVELGAYKTMRRAWGRQEIRYGQRDIFLGNHWLLGFSFVTASGSLFPRNIYSFECIRYMILQSPSRGVFF